jgi:hypothetical protein
MRFLKPTENLPAFEIQTRLEYIIHCIPESLGAMVDDDGLPVFPVGLHDQVSMASFVWGCGPRWIHMWRSSLDRISPGLKDFTHPPGASGREAWKLNLYLSALVTQGLHGWQLLTLPTGKISRECLQGATRIKYLIERLSEPPGIEIQHLQGKDYPVSFAPCFYKA